MHFRGFKLAGRSVFVVRPNGKIAWLDRKFGVPKSLEGSDLLAALDKVLGQRIEAAVKDVKDPQTKALRLLFLKAVSALLTRDGGALKPLLLPAKDGGKAKAKGMIAKFAVSGSPRPSVLDLVDPARIQVASDKEGLFEVSAKTSRKKPDKIAFSVKQTKAGYRILARSR